MTPAATLPAGILGSASDVLGEFLPRLAGALVLVVVGFVVVRFVVRLVVRLLVGAGVDRGAERLGLGPALARLHLPSSLSRLVGLALRIVLSLVVVFAALSLLGLEELGLQVVLYLPRLLVALALLVVGLALGRLARERVDRAAYQMDLPGPLGRLAQGAVLVLFGVLALALLGIPTAIVTVLLAIAVGGVALTIALALGLGSREVARELSAGRLVRSAYRVGQEIRAADIQGTIVRIENGATVLSDGANGTIRVPHHLLIEEIVTVIGDDRTDVPDTEASRP